MAQKRKAQEAFGKSQAQLSAFAAAKLARQPGYSSQIQSFEPGSTSTENSLVVEAAITPYDGVRSGTTTPGTQYLDEESNSTQPQRPSKVPFSTFISTISNVMKDDDKCLELRLRRDETIALLGEYEIEILKPHGAITVAGAVLQVKHGRKRIFAPSTHPQPQIRAVQDNTDIRISSTLSGLRKLEKLSPLFRNIWDSNSTRGRSFTLLGSTEDDALHRALSVLEIDKDMDTVLKALSSKCTAVSQKPRIMAIGAKSSGKSTFNRLLCNYMHTFSQGSKLLYLDLDPGQPEFGPPGQVSLVEVSAPILGPPFTHPAGSTAADFKLVRCHTIAATTFKDDPEHYVACVADLIQNADKKYPIIVNSCGWVSGLGASILVEIASLLAITDIILLEPLEASLVESVPGAALHRIPRRAPRPSSRTPAEARAMQTMAYSHQKPGYNNAALTWSGRPINKFRPWIVSYAGLNPGISAILSYGQSPNSQFLAEVLDGSVVAVVILEQVLGSISIFRESDAQNGQGADSVELAEVITRTSEDLPYVQPTAQGINRTLNPHASHCIGLALVRCIDAERKELHLVISLPVNEIAALEDKQVVLVRGGFDPPGWAYLEDLYKDSERGISKSGDEGRPWVSEKEMLGIESSVWRLRHPPLASTIAANR